MNKSITEITEDYLDWAPFSLTIREVTRIQAFRLLDRKFNLLSASKVLDVGCGDGRWWTYLCPENLGKIHGIDVSKSEANLAKAVISVQCLDITLPDFSEQLKGRDFDLVIGNCSLEHVLNIDLALTNISEVMCENGNLLLFVPTPLWAFKGRTLGILQKISPRISMTFSGAINGFFQHWNLYHYRIWCLLLKAHGFRNIEVYGLGNAKSEFLFRLFLPLAAISFFVKSITKKYLIWFLSRMKLNLFRHLAAQKIVDSLDSDLPSKDDDNIFEYVIMCRK